MRVILGKSLRLGALVTCSALALSTISSAQKAGPIVDREVFEAAQTERVESLRKIDNGDGTWSYALPGDFNPTIQVKRKIITWRYAGQARFSNKPTFGAARTWISTEERLIDRRQHAGGLNCQQTWVYPMAAQLRPNVRFGSILLI